MPERPPFSRFRRLPGLFRTGDRKPIDPHEEPSPLTVYLPGRILDLAESLAARHGAGTVQEYCEELLRMAIEHEDAAARAEAVQVTQGTLQSLDEMASDPGYLAEWTASTREHSPEPVAPVLFLEPGDDGTSFARATVSRAVDGPDGFLAILRRGETMPSDVADQLIDALRDLESRLQHAANLDRKLAYSLHRLAFEGQVLLTDSPTPAANDPATVERLRRVQEAVDRVLSGEDIRYYDGLSAANASH